MSAFLSAFWHHLAMFNYEVDPQLLLRYLPARTELDFFNGKCYVSLVGFMFLDAKVKGLSIPQHRSFEEVNLRFYIRYQDQENQRRGVVFIKEYVPKSLLAGVANIMYNERYESTSIAHFEARENDQVAVSYGWKRKYTWNEMTVLADDKTLPLVPGSEEEFIAEHYHGYVRVDESTTIEYEVQHPRWEIYKTLAHDIHVDFGVNYGAEFAFLNKNKPASVLLTPGSQVKVMQGRFV